MAFNEPEVDKWTSKLYHGVKLDERCRRQQFNDYKDHKNPEARYTTIDDVPTHAISATMAFLLDADHAICVVPGAHKADAVKLAVEGSLDNKVAASMHRLTSVNFYFDRVAASKLKTKPTPKY